MKIYIIDDDKQFLWSYEQMLGQKHDVRLFRSADGLFLALELETPDVIICDLCMPFVPGYEVISRLQAKYPQIPIVVATGLEGEEHEVSARSKGHGYYAKGTPFTELEAEICRITTTI